MKRFIYKTAIVSVLCVSISHLLPFFSDMAGKPIWYLTIGAYGLLTVLLRFWVSKSQKGTAIKFTSAVNGTTAVKMLFTLLIVTSYLVSEQPFSKQYVFGVFAVFIAFTVLFVVDAQRLIRKG